MSIWLTRKFLGKKALLESRAFEDQSQVFPCFHCGGSQLLTKLNYRNEIRNKTLAGWFENWHTSPSNKKAPIGVLSISKSSYFRWCQDPDLNWGHGDFQSPALPTELSRLNTLIIYQFVSTLLKIKSKFP